MLICRALLAITSILFAVIVWLHGLTLQSATWCGFVAVLVVLSDIDIRTFLLPDRLTQPLLWAGLVVAALGWGEVNLYTSVWGAVGGYGVLWGVASVFKAITSKDGMGQGDFKLLAAIGAWLGWPALLPVVLLASSSCFIVDIWLRKHASQRSEDEASYIPFGPFLAGAAIVCVLWRS